MIFDIARSILALELFFHIYVELAIVAIFPVVFGIILSQLLFNWRKGLLVTSCILVPYCRSD
jgi:hypothetical protein